MVDDLNKKRRACCMPPCANERFDLVHKFPRSDSRALEWLAAIELPCLENQILADIRRKFFICSRHFRAEDYKHAQSRSLNQNAVPSLNLHTLDSLDHVIERPSHLQRPKLGTIIDEVPELAFEIDDSSLTQAIFDEDPSSVLEHQEFIEVPVLRKVDFARTFRSSNHRKEVVDNEPPRKVSKFELEEQKEETVEETEEEQYLYEYLEEQLEDDAANKKEEMVAQSDYLEIITEKFPSKIKLNYYWLRDHCRCGQCYDSSTAQRKFNFMDIPLTIRPKSYEVGNTLRVVWEDLHESEYDLDFLYNSQYEIKRPNYLQSKAILWDSKQIQAANYARVPLTELICEDAAVKKILDSLVKYGLAFIEKVPPNTHSTEMAITRVFPVMKTFFGEMWTFTNVMDHNDFAYTTSFLPAHNDNTYFNDAAGLQILHCIHHEGTGGENLAVDGFKVIEDLKNKHPDTFDRLVNKWQLPAEYVEPGRNHRYTAPVIKLDPLSGRPQQLRFNMNDRAALDTIPFDDLQTFYTDMHLLASEIQDKQNEWWFKLEPGTIWLFDNWRVLHGRNKYSGKRIMTGSYVLRSEFLSAARVAEVL